MTGLDTAGVSPLTIWETADLGGEEGLFLGGASDFAPAKAFDQIFVLFNTQKTLTRTDGALGITAFGAPGFPTTGIVAGPNLKIADPNGVSVGANQFGLGSNGILNVPNAATPPTVIPGATEVLVYNQTGALKASGGNSVLTTIAPTGGGSNAAGTLFSKPIDWKAGTVQTVGATVATVTQTDVIPDNSSVTLEVYLQGRETTTGDIASTMFLMRARRVAGVLTLVNVETVLETFATGSDAALVAATAVIDVSANTLRLRVTGVAATTIEWDGDMRVRINA
jgi:hypothetical protein